jgi:hypothetical protein
MPQKCVRGVPHGATPHADAGCCAAGCDLTVLLMCVATVWETVARLHAGREPAPTAIDGKIDSFWDVIELVFTLFFAFEVMLKVLVFGWLSYWREITNRYGRNMCCCLACVFVCLL